MKRKHATELHAWLQLGLVLLFVALAISGEVKDTFGWVFLFLFISFFSWNSYRNFRAIDTIRDEEREHAPPTDATSDEKIAFYRRHMIIALCLVPVLPFIFLGDINALAAHPGQAHGELQIFLWLYKHLGYWPLLLALPALMLAAAFGYHIKIRRIRSGRDG
jgi:hypothetical protein